jgi:LCP family protein required for cell wall assembly
VRQFNAAYPIGGPACVQRTVEALTGLRIDHFVEVDFLGFVDMVDAVGGVTVYIPEPISDPQSNIYFDVGCQTLDGKQALGYVRVRKGVGGGDGSDIGRIERQQAFLTSLIQKVTSSGVLFNPLELYSFLDAVTRSVTTDPGIGSIRSMASVAVRVREIGLESIEFTTVPNEEYPPDPNRVQWKQPEADEMWRKLRLDQPLTPRPTAAPSASGSQAPTGSRTPGATDGTQSPSPSPSPNPTLSTTTADQPVCPAS